MNPRAPYKYGLPKLHKRSSPMNPVASYVNVPAYILCKKTKHDITTINKFQK